VRLTKVDRFKKKTVGEKSRRGDGNGDGMRKESRTELIRGGDEESRIKR